MKCVPPLSLSLSLSDAGLQLSCRPGLAWASSNPTSHRCSWAWGGHHGIITTSHIAIFSVPSSPSDREQHGHPSLILSISLVLTWIQPYLATAGLTNIWEIKIYFIEYLKIDKYYLNINIVWPQSQY